MLPERFPLGSINRKLVQKTETHEIEFTEAHSYSLLLEQLKTSVCDNDRVDCDSNRRCNRNVGYRSSKEKGN